MDVVTGTPRSVKRFPSADRLARHLLTAASDGQPIAHVFQTFLERLDGQDEAAINAFRELRERFLTADAEPYFLELLQAAHDRQQRKRRGVYFTPGPVVDYLLRRIELLVPEGPLHFVDPACGGGVFLLAAAKMAATRPGSTLTGYDISPDAVDIARALLSRHGVGANIQCLNSLTQDECLAINLAGRSGTLIILGNPPYANYGRLNRSPWMDKLLWSYRPETAERKLNLTDDFIKFLRWGQYWIDRAGRGALAMITSRTYLSGVTHSGMRRSLASSFPEIEIVDLHGDQEPGDENIFPIRRGVTIGIFARQRDETAQTRQVTYASVRGTRDSKLKRLQFDRFPAERLLPQSPQWLFLPPEDRARTTGNRWLTWPRLSEIFASFISGVQTKNDALLVNFDHETLAERMRNHLGADRFDSRKLLSYTVGPFDRRWIYYDRELVGRPRWTVMRHMVQTPNNQALVFMRQSTQTDRYDHALVVDTLASDRVFYSRRGAPFLVPLWKCATPGGCNPQAYYADSARECSPPERTCNLASSWCAEMESRIGGSCLPEAMFAWIYAVLHSPHYRRQFLGELQRDFPRIPWPRDNESFQTMNRLGQRLVDLHLMRNVGDIQGINVLAEIPSFHVGGYNVIERWLHVRRKQTLDFEEKATLGRLIFIAEETKRLVAEIDNVGEVWE